MNRKSLLIATILTIMLCVIVISGCTTTSPAGGTPAASTAAGPTTGSSTGNEPSGSPSVSTSGAVTTVTGSQGGDFKVTSASSTYYLFNIQSKDQDFELDYAGNEYSHPEDLYATTSGSYAQSFIRSIPSEGQFAFTVKSSMPYTITITPLPTGAAPVSAPQTFSGKGAQAVGPITLNAGSANFNLKGPSMKDSGFSVQLYSDTTGQFVSMIDTNAGGSASDSAYQSQKSIAIPSAGNYYVLVLTNGNDAWEVDVSQ